MVIEEIILPVRIRTITINGKRLTKSIISQFIYEKPITWDEILGYVNVHLDKNQSENEVILIWITQDDELRKFYFDKKDADAWEQIYI